MEINVWPIRTEDDYDAALTEVDSLMDTVLGTDNVNG
jgi:antitoxin component HigA of HigAB toxin-antitoxin module